ncbi:MAG TPA: peptide deformylase, partial [Polyangiaceae bacterium]
REVARDLSREELASPAIQTFIDDLVETMHDANGAGIAANQVYEPIRVCVIEIKNNPRYPYKPNYPLTILVNPRVTLLSDERFENYEGCLSVPNLRGKVRRSPHVRVDAWTREGKEIVIDAKGITAGTFQHEVDHLDGKLFVDRVEDPTTFSTWADFDRFHRDAFVDYARGIVAKYGS